MAGQMAMVEAVTAVVPEVGGRTDLEVTMMEAAMARISAGDTGAEIPGLRRGDEIGRMAAALAVFRDKVAENERFATDRVRT